MKIVAILLVSFGLLAFMLWGLVMYNLSRHMQAALRDLENFSKGLKDLRKRLENKPGEDL